MNKGVLETRISGQTARSASTPYLAVTVLLGQVAFLVPCLRIACALFQPFVRDLRLPRPDPKKGSVNESDSAEEPPVF